MNDWDRDVRGAVAAHRTLEARLATLSDDDAARPSLLPGWTVGHVLTHIARNADGVRLMLEGALRGEIAPQYPGGLEQRNADIVAGATRGAAALVDDVLHTNSRLEATLAAMTPDAWAGQGISVMGPVACTEMPFRRWRETEVHHADLGLGYSWEAWPAEYVRAELQRLTMLWDSRQPMGLTGLPAAAKALDERRRVAWLLGRVEVDGLDPARLMG